MVKKKEGKTSEKILSLSAVGLDTTGLVATITGKIHELGGNIIDVEENCRRGLFSIFLIIDFSSTGNSLESIKDDLEALEESTGLRIIVTSHDKDEVGYSTGKENHVVTILGVDKPGIIAKVSTFFMKRAINIESCKMIARGKFFSMEMVIDTSKMPVGNFPDRDAMLAQMKDELKELCKQLNQSVVVQSENIYMKVKKLVVFDVESTLIQDASLRSFLNKVRDEVSSATGECPDLGLKENEVDALVTYARYLKGTRARDFEKLSSILQLNPGTIELIHILKSMGFKIALLTSGFNFFIKKIFESAGVDYAFSNTLKVSNDGIITGELEEPIITDATKGEILEFIMNVEGLNRDQVIAVGDGSTRSHFMKNVGLSLAFKPDGDAMESDGIISSDQIMNLLYCLGIPKQELENVLDGNGEGNDEK